MHKAVAPQQSGYMTTTDVVSKYAIKRGTLYRWVKGNVLRDVVQVGPIKQNERKKSRFLLFSATEIEQVIENRKVRRSISSRELPDHSRVKALEDRVTALENIIQRLGYTD